MYPQSQLIFPHHCLHHLRGARDEQWDELVTHVQDLPETHLDSLGLVLMIVRICDCASCDMDSYKASLGCTACAQRAVTAERSLDNKLFQAFDAARNEVSAYLNNRKIKGQPQ